MNYQQRRGCRVLLGMWVGFLCLGCAATCLAQKSGVQERVTRYQLVEEWSVAAQGPVYLRETRVKETYQLDVTDQGVDSEAKRRLQVRFVQVAVEADVPAQKRKGSFDSEHAPTDLTVEHHELVRSIALSGQTLTLVFAPDGKLIEISGTEPVIRRLDEIYDKDLRGSEQDLHTRDFERQRLTGGELCQTWADVFMAHQPSLRDGMERREIKSEVTCNACIPSESWMRRVTLPITESIQSLPQSEGSTTVEKTAVLADSQSVETSIGGVAWKYDPRELKRTLSMQVGPDGRVDSMSSMLTAVLSTTLSLGNDIPIQMTIRHATQLSTR